MLSVVGEGAYGVVLKCRNKESEEICAIKKFKESDDDEILRKTALREVKLLRMLRHTNIVSLTEAFRRKGKLYLVFEYVEKNLLEVLEEQPQGLDPALVRYYIFQLCQAIHWCHSHDVVHRDIKPENLLIDVYSRQLKLCDFGFARILNDSKEELTDYVATRWYRAPELLLGSARYEFSVDIWAIGCIMGEITDGQPMFPGESEVDQLYIVQKIIGPLIPDHMDLFMTNPRFAGLKFPDMSRPETLQKKYIGTLSKRSMNFIQLCLNMDPVARPTSQEALEHPYFYGLQSKEDNSRGESQENADRNILPSNIGNNAPQQQHHHHHQQQQQPHHNQQWNSTGIHGGVRQPTHEEAQQKALLQQQQQQLIYNAKPSKYFNNDGGMFDQNQNGDQYSRQMDNSVGGNCGQNYNGASSQASNGSNSHQRSRQRARQKEEDKEARERERIRELEREAERQREKQRENEMRAFREFSTKLPIKLRNSSHDDGTLTPLYPNSHVGEVNKPRSRGQQMAARVPPIESTSQRDNLKSRDGRKSRDGQRGSRDNLKSRDGKSREGQKPRGHDGQGGQFGGVGNVGVASGQIMQPLNHPHRMHGNRPIAAPLLQEHNFPSTFQQGGVDSRNTALLNTTYTDGGENRPLPNISSQHSTNAPRQFNVGSDSGGRAGRAQIK